MIPTSERPYLYDAFGAQAEPLLRHAGIAHTIEHDRDYYYLTVPARGPAGFTTQLNVGWQTAYLILERDAVITFHAATPEAGGAVAGELLALLARLAGPDIRVRLRKAGSTTYAWQVEVRDGRGWRVAHQGRNWLFNYFGKRHEVVLENLEAGTASHTG